jgi:hypothetical protein
MREMDDEEQAVKAVARDAVSRITACSSTTADDYDARAAIVFAPDAPELTVFQLAWDDDHRGEFLMYGNLEYVVPEVVSAPDAAGARRVAEAWVGPTSREVGFRFLPGVFQSAFVAALAGSAPPFWGLDYIWVPAALDAEYWPIRVFPSGFGENPVPIGEVGFLLMSSIVIDEFWRLRGW